MINQNDVIRLTWGGNFLLMFEALVDFDLETVLRAFKAFQSNPTVDDFAQFLVSAGFARTTLDATPVDVRPIWQAI